jgi:2-polyprenyl-3-methyl-5-hydroxy-6-metoxy-1,4-benzoquinol methylase
MFRLWLLVIKEQTPKTGMRTLLEIDDLLTWHINRMAIRYDNGVHAKHRLMRYHDFFVERLQPGERVLDIGCGYGAVAYSMASRAQAIVTGIDLEAYNIDQARHLFQHPNLTFVQGDVLQELPSETFETVVMSNVLEHIEERVAFLKQAQASIKPRRWLLRVPMFNRHWRVPLRQELGMYFFSDPTHYTEYTQQSFEAEMEAARLTITHMQINWGEIWAEVTAAHD